MDALRTWVWKYFGALLFEDKTDGTQAISLGRVMLILVFLQCMWTWNVHGMDVPSSMLQTLWALLAYVTGTKIAASVKRPTGPGDE